MARIREKSRGLTVFGFILLIALSIGNLAHLFWTIWLIIEQAETGFGYSTNLEMLALLPWFSEMVFLPTLICSVVWFGFHTLRRSERPLLIANAVLASALLSQYVITNLFLFY